MCKLENVTPENKSDVFLAMAFVISCLSKDAQTKHGCIITNQDNHILGAGYNSFPRGCNDEHLPNTRPDKYPHMIHAERNAVSFCEHRPVGGIAYVTGECCYDCLTHLWQNGIEEVWMSNRPSAMIDKKERKLIRDFLENHVNMTVNRVTPDFNYLLPLITYLHGQKFIQTELEKFFKCV